MLDIVVHQLGEQGLLTIGLGTVVGIGFCLFVYVSRLGA